MRRHVSQDFAAGRVSCTSADSAGERPQSVFALQKELSRETERQYTKLSFSERLKLQLENLTTSAKA